MSRTLKAYKDLAQGGGLAEPWVLGSKNGLALKEPKESVESRAIRAAQFSRMTISCDVAGFSAAPSERFAFNVEYPGFRQASTLG